MKPLYEISADFLPDGAAVVSFDGEEALNTPYRFRVLFTLPLEAGLDLDLDSAIGKTAQLVINGETSPRCVYSGTIAALELVEDLERVSSFRLHLAPKAWRLGLGEHSRVFVDKALPDILRETLEDGGLSSSDYELRLTHEYRPLPHVCQYRESRLAFVTRWLSRVGAHYFFEQGDQQEKLILSDSPSSQSACRSEPVPFVPQSAGDVTAREALSSFRSCHVVVPKKVAVADYSPLNPALKIEGSADVVPAGPGGEVHLFKVNEERPADALAHAKARAAEHLSAHATCRAGGFVFGLVPGQTFELEGHPRDELNRKYLVTAARHRGAEDGTASPKGLPRQRYHVDIDAVEGGAPHVALTAARWPRVAGTVRARVDGDATSEYAQLDPQGRYLVRLMLDESGLPDGAASTRIRMAQPHAGNPEGVHFPLRKGTEVQVGFVRGDPDQPLILGVVPDATTPSPVVKSNSTQNVVQTGGLSRLEIEDESGSEYIDISTPPEKTFVHLGAHAGLGSHNYVLSTDGDASMHTGGNRDITVFGDQTEKVTGDVKETYHSTQKTTVDGAKDETIDGGSTQTIHAGSTQSIDGGSKETLSGGETRTVSGGQKESLSGGRTQTITGASTETITGALTQSISGGATITTPAKNMVTAGGGFEMSTPATVTMTAAGGFNLLAPGGQKRLDEDFTAFGEKYEVIAPNQFVFVVKRIDFRVLYLEIIGIKMDFFGQKATVGSVSRQTAVFDLKTRGANISRHIFSQETGAFKAYGG